MAKAWSTWLPDLMPQLPDCPDILIAHEVKRAAQVFFEKTHAWSVTLEPVDVEAEQTEVRIMPQKGQEIVRIQEAWYKGKALEMVSADVLSGYLSGDWQTHTGTPVAFFQETSGVMRLYPIPLSDAEESLRVRVAVKPSESAAGIPDELFVNYRDAILMGAKAHLMIYAGKPWSNPELAMKYEADFMSAIANLNASVATSAWRSRIPSNPSWC